MDIYVSTSGGAAGIFPFVQVLDLPYLMADDRVGKQRNIFNAARESADGIQGSGSAQHAAARNQAEGRLETDHAAEGCGTDD